MPRQMGLAASSAQPRESRPPGPAAGQSAGPGSIWDESRARRINQPGRFCCPGDGGRRPGRGQAGRGGPREPRSGQPPDDSGGPPFWRESAALDALAVQGCVPRATGVWGGGEFSPWPDC